ncbi:MAG: tetratricopeptide repeat protein [Bacteroidota bacterium]
MIRILYLSVAFSACCLFSSPSKASHNNPDLRNQIESLMASFQLDSAEALLPALNRPGYANFYRYNIRVYQYLSTQSISYLQNIRGDWKVCIQKVSELPSDDPLRGVMLAEIYCKRAILEFLEKNYLSAVRFTRQGRAQINRNEKRFPGNVEQMKVLGLFNVTLGAVPSKYQWLTNTLGFRGDIEEGLQQLSIAAASSQLLRLEAQILYAFVERNVLGDPQLALNRLAGERAQQGPNILLDYFLANAYLNNRQTDQALEIFNRRSQYRKEGIFFIPYWDYQMGKAYYYKGAQRDAQRYLSKFLKNYTGKLFRTDAYFRLGMSLSLDGSYPVGKRFFKLITEQENSGMDQDEYAAFMAQTFLKQPPSPASLQLFQARNFFDGGYFEQATASLDSLTQSGSSLSQDELTEKYYRMGRIHHAQQQFSEAIVAYQQCVAQNCQHQRYVQAYSYYYLGEIARQKGADTEARNHYKSALNFDDIFYQGGLENRCKTALGEMKRQP